MRGEQLARQWRILRTIESRSHGITVAELAEQEGCHVRTIWRDLAAIQDAGFPLYSEKDGSLLMTTEVGGLVEVMSWVMGFGRQAEVLEPGHLRTAVAEEVQAVAERYDKDGGEATFVRSESRRQLRE